MSRSDWKRIFHDDDSAHNSQQRWWWGWVASDELRATDNEQLPVAHYQWHLWPDVGGA